MFRKNLILLSGFLTLIVFVLSLQIFTLDKLSNALPSAASTQSIVTDKTEGIHNKTAAAAEGTTDTGLIVKLLADNLETSLNKSAAILEVTSKLPEVNSTFYATSISPEIHGIPQDLDTAKRKVAQDILISDKNFEVIFFLMPNGNMYIDEPYSRQENLTGNNFAFRDYYKGAVNTGNTYLANVISSASSGLPQANIAVPIFSEDNRPAGNSTLTGIWGGGLNLTLFSESLQALNLTDGLRIVYVDQFGQKIADSDGHSPLLLNKNGNESFANLQSFRNAVEGGKPGFTVETVNNNKMLIFYEPVKFRSTTWGVLLMQPYND
jgi:Cache domain